MDAWVAGSVKADLLPWAANVITRAWRRHVARRHLMRYVNLRRRLKRLFLQPYLAAWHASAVLRGRGSSALRETAFRGWRDYCATLTHLHERVIAWSTRTLHSMGGLHLTWRLCEAPEGSNSCAPLLSTHHCVMFGTQLAATV